MLLPGAAELNKKMFSKENKYKKAGKKVWLDKNPQRAIEYNKAQAAIKQQASMDFLNSDLFEIKSSVPSN